MNNKSNLPIPCKLIQIFFLWCKNEISSCCILHEGEGNKLRGSRSRWWLSTACDDCIACGKLGLTSL